MHFVHLQSRWKTRRQNRSQEIFFPRKRVENSRRGGGGYSICAECFQAWIDRRDLKNSSLFFFEFIVIVGFVMKLYREGTI